MERFLKGFTLFKDREPKLDLELSSGASAYLNRLMARPNPNFSEFAFLGLGNGNLIDQILVADEDNLAGCVRKGENGPTIASVGRLEIAKLFIKLSQIGRMGDLLVFGHSHPIGIKKIGSRFYWVAADKSLLEPSMGSTSENPTSANDLAFIKWFYTEVVNVPYSGIAAEVALGTPKLRVYRTEDLINIKGKKDLKLVPQTTFTI